MVEFQPVSGYISIMRPRNITASLVEALQDSPVVVLHGARQTGKTTLVRAIAGKEHPARYLTLDDSTVLAAASHDPKGFLGGLEGPVILDEIQRVPELFLALKAEVDRDRTPGRFLLTGSANVLLLPRLSEALVGRMEILTLWTFSQGELEGVKETFVDNLFSASIGKAHPTSASRSDLPARITRGGFPEAVARTNPARRGRWFESYLSAILQRDIRDLANIEGLKEVPRLLAFLAARAAALQNFSEISRGVGIPQTTLKRYLSLLQASFLIHTAPAWTGNVEGRLVKAPKLFFCDSGLLCHGLGLTPDRLRKEPNFLGPVLENFVAMEIWKQISWSRIQPRMHHFRSHAGEEVDIVLEDSRGRIVGVEVKASESVRPHDLKGLYALAKETGERFHRGIVLYGGKEVVSFRKNVHAMPLELLWAV